jgi:drug/metabolite transporter (DMT)-like permease
VITAAPAAEGTRRADVPALVADGVTVVLWSSAFVGIRSAGRSFSPGALSLGRLLVALVALGVLGYSRGERLPQRRLSDLPGPRSSSAGCSGSAPTTSR